MDIVTFSIFRVICILYLFKNLIYKFPQQLIFTYKKFFFLTLIIILSFFTQKFYLQFLPVITIVLITLYTTTTYKLKFDLAVTITCISYAVYYAIFCFNSIIFTFICSPLYYKNIEISYFHASIVNGVLSLFSIFLLFKIKRLKSGLHFLKNQSFINVGVLFCFLILLLKTFANYFIKSSKYLSALPLHFSILPLAFLLFTWWRRQITKSYIEKLRRLEIQSLYDEIEEKDKQIKKLTDDNYSLSRIIHKDNKLIPAMEHSVTDFLLHGDFSDPILIEQYGKQLADKLHTMAQDRKGILETYEQKGNELKMTGDVNIDPILALAKTKADKKGITMECKYTQETIAYLSEKISGEDLSHLLSDLLENAIIAMNGSNGGKLQVIFGKYQKEAYISVADTGQPFDIETLHSFGLYSHTTHEESGGSGIGLMDIWKLKKKYRASIQIQELYKNKENYTKKIIFSFNSKNHYVIQSYRHMDIINTQTRGDLYVIPTDNLEKIGGESA